MLNECGLTPDAQSPIADALRVLVERAPEAPGLDARCRRLLGVLLQSPLPYALATPPADRVCKPLRDMLNGMHLGTAAVAAFLAGLADAYDLDALAEVENDQWIQSWPTDGFIAVTLTPRAAAHLGVELQQRGMDAEESRWMPVNPRPRPRPIQSRPQYRTRRGPGWLDKVPDPAPGPLERAIAKEEQEVLEREAVTDTGEPVRDPATGLPAMEPILLFGGPIPRARPRKRKPKTKKRA